jgi:hypothetical protein
VCLLSFVCVCVMEDFEIGEWFTAAGISEAGQKKLLTAEIKDEAAIELLDNETLQLVKLAPGDFVKFRKSRDVFLKAKDSMPGLEDDTSIGRASGETLRKVDTVTEEKGPLYSLDQLAKFLAGKPDYESVVSQADKPQVEKPKLYGGVILPAPSGFVDTGAAAASASSALNTASSVALSSAFMNDLLCLDDCVTNARGEKPLLPVNFVSTPKGIILDHEQVVTTDKDGNLKLKPSKNRPTADKLTVGQWTSANARILAKLVPRFTPQDLIDYLDYTRKVGDLLNQFTYSSVFILDNDHRIYVNTHGGRWNQIDCTLELYHLKRKEDVTTKQVSGAGYVPKTSASTSVNSVAARKSQSQSRPRIGGGLCWDYNSPEGCTYGDQCRFLHQEPSSSAIQRAPRFQTEKSRP